MAGPKPSDMYNPSQTVAPTTGAPSDYLNVRSNPNQFGAQVGEATQALGQGVSKAGQDVGQIALMKQGAINETLQQNGDTQAQVGFGAIDAKYKAMDGLEAVAAYPQVVQEIQDLRSKIRATMPNPATQRGFDALTLRSMGYALRDAGDYKATQEKKAFLDSANATMNLQIQSMSDPAVAFDPDRSKDAMQGTRYAAEQQLQSHGSLVPGVTIQTDAKGNTVRDADGEPVFLSTPQGTQAKSVYDEFMTKAVGQAYYNQVEVLAKDPMKGNPIAALQFAEENKAKIPPETYAKISAMLYPAIRSWQTHNVAEVGINRLDQAYNQELTGKVSDTQGYNTQGYNVQGVSTTISGLIGGKESSGFRSDEDERKLTGHGGSLHSQGRAVDWEVPQGMDMSQAAKQITDANPNLRVSVEHKNNARGTMGFSTGDHLHIEWGPKAGESSNPITGAPNPYRTKADFYNEHYADAIQQAGEDYLSIHPNDVQGADEARAYTKTRMDDVISQQYHQDRSDMNTVLRVIREGNFTDVRQLENNSDPNVKASWDRMQIANGYGANNVVQHILPANGKGPQATYGHDFYQAYSDVLTGKVKNPEELAGRLGDGTANAPLTNTGMGKLVEIMGNSSDPHQQAVNQSIAKGLQEIYNDATGRSIYPTLQSGKFDQAFNSQMPVLLNAIEAGLQQHKTTTQMFSKEINGKPNPDYVGHAVRLPSSNSIEDENNRELYTTFKTPGSSPQQKNTPPTYDISKWHSTADIRNWYDNTPGATPELLDKAVKEYKKAHGR